MSDRPYVSRSEAKAQGLKRFYTGAGACGHDAERYVVNGGCVDCIRGKSKAHRKGEKVAARGTGFCWNDANRQKLLDAYVDTGDIQGARDMVGVTPSEYHRELGRNMAFKEAVAAATALAIQTLEDRAIHHAGRGNEKLILAVLKAKFPEQYSEKIKVDNTHTHTVKGLSDEEIDKRIARLSRGGVTFEHIPRGKGAIAFAPRGESEAGSSE